MAEQLNSLEALNTVAGVDAAPEAAVDATPAEPQRDELGRSYATG